MYVNTIGEYYFLQSIARIYRYLELQTKIFAFLLVIQTSICAIVHACNRDFTTFIMSNNTRH